MPVPSYEVIIIGAGPYGLSAAAHLRAAHVNMRVFGVAMAFWRNQMPNGMYLRSAREASHIADPHGALTLDTYETAHNISPSRPTPLDAFVAYGQWFQHQVAPDLDERVVVRVEPIAHGFRVVLVDGDMIHTRRVVVAAGIASFAWLPPVFRPVPPSLASHISLYHDLRQFAGKRILVIGGGQSALESAALLHEVGTAVEVVSRAHTFHWLRYNAWLRDHPHLEPVRRALYPPTDVGPPGLNWIVASPDLWGRLPRKLRGPLSRRSIRPAGASWLRPRLHEVTLTAGRAVLDVARHEGRLQITLNDGTARSVDHVLLATGYRVDIARYDFLTPAILRSIRLVRGYPHLVAGLESSVKGLHFLGAPSSGSFGPLMRFVSGTGYSSRALTAFILAQSRTRS